MPLKRPREHILYSTCTELAYSIAKKYYSNIHYVWCTDSFDAPLQPGTSNPKTLCCRYLEQIIKQDRHAFEIDNNKVGILKGARAKLENGVITEDQFKEISFKVNIAEMADFYPVIYLIDKIAVKSRLKIVEPQNAASDSSIEYIVQDLHRDEFELIKMKSILLGIVGPFDE